jgi:hypothetical protein
MPEVLNNLPGSTQQGPGFGCQADLRALQPLDWNCMDREGAEFLRSWAPDLIQYLLQTQLRDIHPG